MELEWVSYIYMLRPWELFPPVNVDNDPSKVGPDDEDADGDEEVVRSARHVLEHHQEEGGVVEGGQELHQEHREWVGEEEEEEEQEEERKTGKVARLPDRWANGIGTSHCPGIRSFFNIKTMW